MLGFPKTKQFLFTALILAYFVVGVFGLFGMATMSHHDGMDMGDCPFMLGETALCEMNVLEHIVSWQVMFTTLPPQLSILALLLLVVLLVFGVLRYLFEPPNASQSQSRFSYSKPTHPSSFTSLLLGSAISPRAP